MARKILSGLDQAADSYLSGVLSPAQITSNQNDYNPTGLSTAAILRLNSDASRNITGLAGGAAGRVFKIYNVGSSDIVLKRESTSSSAGNRFALTNGDHTIPADGSVDLWYDNTSSRWRLSTATSQAVNAGYDVTIADCDNTTTETSVLEFTVPANTLADGDYIVIDFFHLLKQNSGGSVNLTPRVYWGATSAALSVTSWGDSATEFSFSRHLVISRIGTELWVTSAAPAGIASNPFSDSFGTTLGAKLTGLSFTADTVFKVTLQWASANANTYYRMKSAVAKHHTAPNIEGIKTRSKAVVLRKDSGLAAMDVKAWIAELPGTALSIKAIRTGGTAATVNIRKNGSSSLLSSDLSVGTSVTTSGALQNTALALDDYLEFRLISVTGTVTEVLIQLNYEIS